MENRYFEKSLEGMDPQGLRTFLEAHAECETEEQYIHYFTEKEKGEMKDSLLESLENTDKEEEELKAEIKAAKDQLVALKKAEKALRQNIRLGYEERTATVFKMMDTEKFLVQMVDERGIVVKERPMTMQERQLDAFNPPKSISINS